MVDFENRLEEYNNIVQEIDELNDSKERKRRELTQLYCDFAMDKDGEIAGKNKELEAIKNNSRFFFYIEDLVEALAKEAGIAKEDIKVNIKTSVFAKIKALFPEEIVNAYITDTSDAEFEDFTATFDIFSEKGNFHYQFVSEIDFLELQKSGEQLIRHCGMFYHRLNFVDFSYVTIDKNVGDVAIHSNPSHFAKESEVWFPQELIMRAMNNCQVFDEEPDKQLIITSDSN